MKPEQHRYFIVNKPYDMVSQFVSSHNVRLLGDLPFTFPHGTHAIGRLDSNSEGLLILTTDKRVTRLLFNAAVPHRRTYLVQVKNNMSADTLLELQNGVSIRTADVESYMAKPVSACIVDRPAGLQHAGDEIPSHLPHTWLELTLTEGKFHQVRKMVGALHHKCRRLIRLSIEELTLGNLQPGEVRELGAREFFNQLHCNVTV